MGNTGALSARRARVLRAVVHDYIRSAEPVGSGSVAARYTLGVSPATIRNDMAALEDLGYLIQPHTSAGRVPTDLGYRYYVDTLRRPPVLSEASRRAISTFLGDPPPDVEEALRRTAAVLSRVTHYAAVAVGPEIERSRVARADLVALGSAALLLVVSDTGRVDKRVLEVPEGGDAVIRRVGEALERSFSGLSYGAAGRRARRLAGEATGPEATLLGSVADAFGELEQGRGPDHVFLGGASNIAREEAFERRETVRRLFEALEEEAAVLRFLRRLAEDEKGVTVRIGRENPLAGMHEASVVVAPYRVGERPAGTIAVIGPTRMHYSTAISAVRAVAKRLSGLIETLAG